MTTQKAPLEQILAKLRSRQVLKYVENKFILDYGCGKNAWTSQYLQKKCSHVIGYEPSIEKDFKANSVQLHKSLETLKSQNIKFDAVISLAVFEHIKPMKLRECLRELLDLTNERGIVVGTTPRPESRGLLEFLSLRVNLIDKSQILDHKVYYDDLWLQEISENTGWRLNTYKKFQFGMNSLFILTRN